MAQALLNAVSRATNLGATRGFIDYFTTFTCFSSHFHYFGDSFTVSF